MSKIRVGVIGCGQWGPNQIRSFFFHTEAKMVRVCDKDPWRLKSIESVYPGIEVTKHSQDITRADDIDAVVIATPVSTHFRLAEDALNHGKDVLCEKPLTATLNESRTLDRLAEKKKRILMVGHVFLFNPGILKLKEIVRGGECGECYYAHAQRTNLGPIRSDVNAVYDLASHDISIFNFIFESTPKVLSAIGKCYLQPRIEDVVFVDLEYPGRVLAHIHVSWLDPKKVRQITVVGDKKMVSWDDLSLTGPVEIFSKHVEKDPYYKDFGEFHLLAKEGEILIPHVKHIEPLKEQANHFIQCIQTRKQPIAGGKNAVDVMEALEQVEKMLSGQRKKR